MTLRLKNFLLGLLSLIFVAAVALGVNFAAKPALAATPTGTNAATLTEPIDSEDLSSFTVNGAYTRSIAPAGLKFLATINNSDLAKVPSDAEFGLLIIPAKLLGGETLTADTENALKAKAKVTTTSEDVPAGSMGYQITLVGETLEQAFPSGLYGTAFAARAYVKYTYQSAGDTVTAYAYSNTTLNRSIAYVASKELARMEEAGEDVSDASSFLNTIVASTIGSATLSLSVTEIEAGETATATVTGATDGLNQFGYYLKSSDTGVATISDGKVLGVARGTATITAAIGTTQISVGVTVKGPVRFDGGDILYSTQDSTIFIPDGILDGANETIVAAVDSEKNDYYQDGTWSPLALSSAEINSNTVRNTTLTITTSEGDRYVVNAKSYAGVIDELSDFPKFFNNEGVASPFNPSAYPSVAPYTYGYYVVIKDLGTSSTGLTFTQTANSDFQQQCGFNGVLDGQGHTLKFRLMSGALTGLILGNATFKNLAVIYEDASFISQEAGGGYGAFGYMTNGSPVIDNCYIERTNNVASRSSVFGIMARPNARLILRNTVVYGYYVPNDCTWWSNTYISDSSTNAYVVCGRSGAANQTMATNFTKVYTDGTGAANQARKVLAADIADASGFNANFWDKSSGVVWKGATGSVKYTAEKAAIVLSKEVLYSTLNAELLLPESLGFTLDNTVTILSKNGNTTYFENGYLSDELALTEAQITANQVASFEVKIIKDGRPYLATLKSYAGVIDELSDFVTFFDKAPETSYRNDDYPSGILAAQNIYGYYIVTKDLGDGADTLTFTNQTKDTDYIRPNGFSGVLDGQGHTLKFELTKGGLVGLILGNATIKNIAIIYSDTSFVSTDNGGFGVFGYMAVGAPVIDNCYIERTNNVASRSTVYGIMARPFERLVLRNTVVYGYYVTNDTTWYAANNVHISASSTNAYVVCGRSGMDSFAMSTNFTKVYTDGTGAANQARKVLAADIADASGFNANFWDKSSGAVWKGATDSVNYSSGAAVETAVYAGDILYSTNDSQIFLPEDIDFTLDSSVVITDLSGDTTYYTGGEWVNGGFALTSSQISSNSVATFDVKLVKDGVSYLATVKSYAGVIDELADFTTFFNVANTAVYGYYIVTGDLGSVTTELTHSSQTETESGNGFYGVLDGQGHTVKFKLMSGGLVGLVLNGATVKNLGVIFNDSTSTHYGAFGRFAFGSSVIDNCYIEQVNNHYYNRTTFGIMATPFARLILRNTVVYGFNISGNDSSDYYGWSADKPRTSISASSTNAYVIHARTEAADYKYAANFTAVFNDGVEDGSREVLLSEIADASGFNNSFWSKENGKLIWKGLETVTATWIKGEETIVETVTKDSRVYAKSLPANVSNETEETTYHWATSEGGDAITFNSSVKYTSDRTFYMVKVSTLVGSNILYSTLDGEIFFPTELDLELDSSVSIVSRDGETSYYEHGFWVNDFALTAGQIAANEVGSFDVKITKDGKSYFATVKSYAGVIDELDDFVTFFDIADEAGVKPDTYGYYIVTKDLGDGTDELTFAKQTTSTTFTATNGFNGVLDGQGHTLKFKLMKGGLVGLILGNATVKNIAIIYEDASAIFNGESWNANTGGGWGVFGFMTVGNPAIENCYIERTNNPTSESGQTAIRSSVYGLMARPRAKLILRNTVVYGSNVTMDCTTWDGEAARSVSASSTNAYVVGARDNAPGFTMSANFTGVCTGWGNRFVELSEIADASGFNDDYWDKNGDTNKLTWKGAADMPVSSAGAIVFEDRYLADSGTTEYEIVIPTGADATLVKAKDELIALFEEATGVTLTVAEDSSGYTTADKYISIGDTQTFAASGITLAGLNRQGYSIKTVGNTIYINAESSLGNLYGVYGLLNELFGFEQFSEDCYNLDSNPSPRFPTLNVTENPDFEIRTPVSSVLTGDYAERMRMADVRYILPAGDYHHNGGAGWTTYHNAFEIIPPSYWQASKPNWFSDDSTQLCYTAHGNSADYTALVNQIVDVLILTLGSDSWSTSNYPEQMYITLTSEDGDGHCTCSACTAAKAKYGSDVGAVIALCNDVRAGIEDWMDTNPTYKRDITLLFFAYNAYVSAPATYNSSTGKYVLNGGLTMRSDVGVLYAVSDYVNYYYDIYDSENDAFRLQFDAWADITAASGSPLCLWTYSQNFWQYMLRADVYGANTFYNSNAYNYFAERNVQMFFNQGVSFTGVADTTGYTLTSFEKLNVYIDAQMMWDSTQNVITLTDKWFNAMFGAGASYMRQLYNAENTLSRTIFNTTKKGIPSDSTNFSAARNYFRSNINTWLGYITSAKNAVNNDSSLTSAQKAAMISHINDEWLAVKFWHVYTLKDYSYASWYGVKVNTTTAKAEFREILGYNSSTGTYARDVRINERSSVSLSQWVENGFSGF